ncbi:hypothetical protein COCNU_10G005170 [Cocos nucifera]|uniref:Uncharacterized protein n=1 Tax=Cocos nucifera TaxID=13894 RepID=A0A8K0INC7_COCNU|nr:hypothetical protein COCNU_10G005170 [Cocos nucifera]
METLSLLQRHRRDRRKLLEFIFSVGLIRTPSGDSLDLSDVDLDAISVDYFLECVESGAVFDPSAATKRYTEALDYPVMVYPELGDVAAEPFLNCSGALTTATFMLVQLKTVQS